MSAPMPAPDPTGHVPPPARTAQEQLLLRLLSALVREDVAGLRTQSQIRELADGPWLERLRPGGGSLLVPVRPGGFQCAYDARLPLVRVLPRREVLRTCEQVVRTVAELADPRDRGGFADLIRECHQTLATMKLHERTWPATREALVTTHGPDPARWTGLRAATAFDVLAARHDHPVYPTARGRAGLGEAQLRAYAPELAPRFALRWVALPAAVVRGPLAGLVRAPSPSVPEGTGLHGSAPTRRGPAWWPTPGSDDPVSAALAAHEVAWPVHPLTVDEGAGAGASERNAQGALTEALRALGGRILPESHLGATPTLSMRTVALDVDPTVHLKLPLATASLGMRNRRTIAPGTLVDGAVGQRIVEAVRAGLPRFDGVVLHADEQVWGHAEHPLLAALLRRWPPGLETASVVPLAALLAPAPDDRPVLEHLAQEFTGGDPLALLDRLWSLLVDWQVALHDHGIALESHQQNVSLALDRDPQGHTRLRLLLKDNDGLRVHRARAGERLGAAAALLDQIDDPRIVVDDPRAVDDVFLTITVHLCGGALAHGLAERGLVPLASSLDLLREHLDRATRAVSTGPTSPGARLRERLLEHPTLPVKAMLSAGTLLSKERSGAADINKHYTTGPNYLRALR